VKYTESSDIAQVLMPVPPLRKVKSEKADKVSEAAPRRPQMPSYTSRPLNVGHITAFEDDACIECQYSLQQDGHFA